MGNSDVYLRMFKIFKVSKIECRRGKVRGELYEAARDESCFRLEAGLYPKWDKNHERVSVARDVSESWKKIKCMCVYSSDTPFAQHFLYLEMLRRAR